MIGVGNPLREDDGIGIALVERLEAAFGGGLRSTVIFEPDIALSETLSAFDELIVVDAYAGDTLGKPYVIAELVAAKDCAPTCGFVSHIFDWGMILAMSRDFFGHAPKAHLLGVRAKNFGISECITPECSTDAESAYEFLLSYLSGQ